MSQETVGVGVIGIGRMGLLHCRMVAETPGLRLVAGASRAEVLRRQVEERFGVRTYADGHDLLVDPAVDAVVIATVSQTHEAWAIDALGAGKHVVVDKPMALSAAGVERMMAASRQAGRLLTCFQNRRWDPDFLAVQKLLAQGPLGKVFIIESRALGYGAGWPGWGAAGMAHPWRVHREDGGGMLFDWGPHLIDQALRLVASPLQSVYGDLQSRVWSTEVDDHFSCALRFAGGAVVRLEASNDVRLPVPRWLLVGTAGTACSESAGRGAAGCLRIQAGDPGAAETVRPYPAGTEVCLPFYENWYRAMAEGAPLAVPAEETLAVLRVLDMVRASAEGDEVLRA